MGIQLATQKEVIHHTDLIVVNKLIASLNLNGRRLVITLLNFRLITALSDHCKRYSDISSVPCLKRLEEQKGCDTSVLQKNKFLFI